MGGFGSGRSYGRPVAEHARRIDLNWMLRTGRAVAGQRLISSLYWFRGSEPAGNIRYDADMTDPHNARLVLNYTLGDGADRESIQQVVRLVSTKPNFGGKRWWMVCPYGGGRCTKLFLPGNGDRFASRKAWRMGYQSQRQAWHDAPFERLYRLQRKLGGVQGYDELPSRPKRMRHMTYERHMERYWAINDQCDAIWLGMVARLTRRR